MAARERHGSTAGLWTPSDSSWRPLSSSSSRAASSSPRRWWRRPRAARWKACRGPSPQEVCCAGSWSVSAASSSRALLHVDLGQDRGGAGYRRRGPAALGAARLERIGRRVRYPAALKHGPGAEAGGGGGGSGVPAPPGGLEGHREADLGRGQRVGPEQRAAGGEALGPGTESRSSQQGLEGALGQVGHALRRGARPGRARTPPRRASAGGRSRPNPGSLSDGARRSIVRTRSSGSKRAVSSSPARRRAAWALVAARLGEVERPLEGLGGGGVLTEQPQRSGQALQRARPLAAGQRVLGGQRQARRSGRIAGGRLGLTQLREQLGARSGVPGSSSSARRR